MRYVSYTNGGTRTGCDDTKNPDINCYFNSNAKGNFLIELSQKHGITALPVFPRVKFGGCTMTTRNAYVVGPDGELYKCWNDIGEQNSVVGNVDSISNWNTSLIAEGMVGASYLNDEECVRCFFFPICDGGCPQIRMFNKRNNQNRDSCSYFKNHMEELLEIHYEQKTTLKT